MLLFQCLHTELCHLSMLEERVWPGMCGKGPPQNWPLDAIATEV